MNSSAVSAAKAQNSLVSRSMCGCAQVVSMSMVVPNGRLSIHPFHADFKAVSCKLV